MITWIYSIPVIFGLFPDPSGPRTTAQDPVWDNEDVEHVVEHRVKERASNRGCAPRSIAPGLSYSCYTLDTYSIYEHFNRHGENTMRNAANMLVCSFWLGRCFLWEDTGEFETNSRVEYLPVKRWYMEERRAERWQWTCSPYDRQNSRCTEHVGLLRSKYT